MRLPAAIVTVAALVFALGVATQYEAITRRNDMCRSEEEVVQILNRISTAVVDLTAPDDLFRVKDFVSLYENPAGCVQVAVHVYGGNTASVLEKRILGYTMQRMETADLVVLIRGVHHLSREGRIHPSLLEEVAFPTLNWGARLPMEYQHPEVFALLGELAADESLPDSFRQYIRTQVMTGQAKEAVLDLRAAGQLPAPP